MTTQPDDELWSAIGDPVPPPGPRPPGQPRRGQRQLAGRAGAVLPPGRLQAPGRARALRPYQPAQAGPGGPVPGRDQPSRPGLPGHGRGRRPVGSPPGRHQAPRRSRPRGKPRDKTIMTNERGNPTHPPVVTQAAYQSELDKLRAREKAHTREGDAIAAARRRLPMVEVAASLPPTASAKAAPGAPARSASCPTCTPATSPTPS